MLSIYAREVTLPNPRRGWATTFSFALQTMGVALLLALPLIHPSMLPRLELTPPLVMLSQPPRAPQMQQSSATRGTSNFAGAILVAPPRIPGSVSRIDDHGIAPVPAGPCNGCVEGGTGNSDQGVLSTLLNPSTTLPPHTSLQTRTLRLSTPMEAFLVHRVQPEYPFLAKAARQQGVVVIEAVISKQGTIENLQVLSGPPLLVRAAVEAVRQWRYRPYLLNGEPVEVQTQVTVNFVLGN